MKILVIGSLNTDLVAQVERLPNEGETLLGKELIQLIGGKGANQSSAAVKQGVDVTMWGIVGQDAFGNHIVNSIKALGIRSEITEGSKTTGTALIETNAQGKNRIVVIPGANSELTVEQVKSKLFLLDEHDIVVFQFEIPIPTIEYLAQEAKKRQKVVIINPAPAFAMSETLISNTDYLIPNEHELSLITKMPTSTEEEILNAVSTLTKFVPHVITTLGEKGILYAHKDQRIWIRGCSVKTVDTTGAGDAFVGGFAGALAQGLDVRQAIEYANKVAAISVTRLGAFASAGSAEEVQNFDRFL